MVGRCHLKMIAGGETSGGETGDCDFGLRVPSLDHKFRFLNEIQDELWKRYLKEVVPTKNFTNRKWLKNTASLDLGDVCVLIEPSLRGRYPLGRIVRVFPNRDGRVRVADVLVGKKVYRRSLTRLVKLCSQSECPERMPPGVPPAPDMPENLEATPDPEEDQCQE